MEIPRGLDDGRGVHLPLFPLQLPGVFDVHSVHPLQVLAGVEAGDDQHGGGSFRLADVVLRVEQVVAGVLLARLVDEEHHEAGLVLQLDSAICEDDGIK